MDLSNLIKYLENFFDNRFDFDTISNDNNCPFIQISLLQTNKKFISQTHGFYLAAPNKKAVHKNRSIDDLSGVNILVDTYLVQDSKKLGLCEMPWGCINGIATTDLDIILCSVITNIDDAKFLCKTILSQTEIFVGNNMLKL